jgi:hypothetical protein
MAAVIFGEERYVFDCEWYDQQAELIRYYRITFYPTDQTIEMVSRSIKMVKCEGTLINKLVALSSISVNHPL